MSRRELLTSTQRDKLLAFPTDENEVHWHHIPD
jgi:hypothetical protein